MDHVTRLDPPTEATEQVMLAAFLDDHRATLLQKIAGLDHADLLREAIDGRTGE